jgi:hypothetical protein
MRSPGDIESVIARRRASHLKGTPRNDADWVFVCGGFQVGLNQAGLRQVIYHQIGGTLHVSPVPDHKGHNKIDSTQLRSGALDDQADVYYQPLNLKHAFEIPYNYIETSNLNSRSLVYTERSERAHL